MFPPRSSTFYCRFLLSDHFGPSNAKNNYDDALDFEVIEVDQFLYTLVYLTMFPPRSSTFYCRFSFSDHFGPIYAKNN